MAREFNYAPGTGGIYGGSRVTVATTELNSLADAGTFTTSVNGTSGVFTQTSFSNAIFGYFMFKFGGNTTTVAPASLRIWYLESSDDGTSYETGTAAGRAPDCEIIFQAAALTSANYVRSGLVRLPALKCKFFVESQLNVTMAASNNILYVLPIATLQNA